MNHLKEEALSLLISLIESPSFSREEDHTAQLIGAYLTTKGVLWERVGNNVWAKNKQFDSNLPTVLLNSHHDTVKPNQGYTRDPFRAELEDGKLFGLGSNDAGGCLVSLIAAFVFFYEKKLPYNLILAATAEEEISGSNGIESLLPHLPVMELAIVGEPTLLQMAVAEKGLVVIDATIEGKAGHAARNEGINAIYLALDDLLMLREFRFRKSSTYLGENKATATIIHAGSQHNVVPDRCTYTIDVRVTDAYTLEEAVDELRQHLKAALVPRSLRLNSSRVDPSHKIVKLAQRLGIPRYGSPTLSDQALIPYPSIKFGPGDSARSHSPDEFIYVHELSEGIEGYIQLLEQYFEVNKTVAS